jgi:tetratricopeptide (TPR) repeat protein
MIDKQIIFLFFSVLFLCNSCKEPSVKYIPISKNESRDIFVNDRIVPDSHFLGDQNCKTCHLNEFKAWKGSHHDKAMQEASEAAILANFNNTSFKSQGVTSKFFKRGIDYFVNTEGPDGEYHDFKIEYTFGVTPLQQYIVKFPDGHYQCLRTAWDSEKNKWFDLYPDFKVVHSEWLHWSRGGLKWNTMCSDCHSTNVRKNYDEKTNSYNTKYSLINVNCEACHGPGKNHVNDVSRFGSDYKASATLKMTLNTNSKLLVDQCARCHMRREQISNNYNFEGSMLDHYFPQLITKDIYHPDGQILDESYVYGSFIQSKMFHNDVSCIDCHDSHSLQVKFNGNKLCTQCHVPKTYDSPKHHFHLTNSEGSKCINCHMTGKFYMGNDFRRDHSFRIPRPDLSIKYDTPNACVQCHNDKDNTWAWKQFQTQYGIPDYIHFSELLAPGLSGEENGLTSLLELARDTIYPDFARASAVRNMTNYLSPDLINDLIFFLNDDSPLVKGASLDVLGEINAKDYITQLLPLLKDPKRTVRIKAFFAISGINEFQISEDYKEVYGIVRKEYNTYLNTISDFVGGRVRRANYYLKKGDLQNAIKSYESALEIDPINNIIRTNLAYLYYQNRDLEKAEQAYKTIIKQEPEYGPTYYSYSLLLAELNRDADAIKTIKKAILYMPQNIKCYYNLSLLYDKSNNFKDAKKTLYDGLKVDAQNEDLLYLLAYLYLKHNNDTKAKPIVSKLLEINPGNSKYINFYNQLNANSRARFALEKK